METLPPPPVLQPAAGVGARKPASAALVIGVAIAVLAVGLGAFLFTRSSNRTTSAATIGTASSDAPALDVASLAKAQDEQTADRLIFHARDFPDQWRPDPKFKSATQTGGGAVNRVAACGGLADLSRPTDVIVDSPSYTSGIFSAYSAAQITDDPAKAAADFAQLQSGDFLTCFHDVIVDSLGGPEVCACLGLEVTPVEFPAPPNAPPMTYSFGVIITVHGQFFREIDGLLIADGRTELSLLFAGTTGPFPAAFGNQLITTELQRLKDNPTS